MIRLSRLREREMPYQPPWTIILFFIFATKKPQKITARKDLSADRRMAYSLFETRKDLR
jgi:hypothetical protein